jgi:hypothetical protein
MQRQMHDLPLHRGKTRDVLRPERGPHQHRSDKKATMILGHLGGDCLTCTRLGECSETSPDKIKTSYVCSLFRPVPEPVYMARHVMMETYGEDAAIAAMLDRPEEPDPEEDEDESETEGEANDDNP